MTKKSTVAGFLAIIWMCVIFAFSAQIKEESSEVSTALSYRFVSSAGSFLGLDLDIEEIQRITAAIEGYVRKAAHMTEYAILAVLLFVWLDRWKLSTARQYITSVILSALYAASDEFHQRFVQGRTGSLRDVFIDSLGAVLGVLIYMGVLKCISFLCSRHRYRETGSS